jgi:hypothetical protein
LIPVPVELGVLALLAAVMIAAARVTLDKLEMRARLEGRLTESKT